MAYALPLPGSLPHSQLTGPGAVPAGPGGGGAGAVTFCSSDLLPSPGRGRGGACGRGKGLWIGAGPASFGAGASHRHQDGAGTMGPRTLMGAQLGLGLLVQLGLPLRLA